jgi:hypothetical protein
MTGESKHEHFCFAGQPAPCKGYFPNDVLPCVCGVEGDAVTALSRVAVPAPLGGELRDRFIRCKKVWRRGIQAQTAVTAAVAAIPTAG